MLGFLVSASAFPAGSYIAHSSSERRLGLDIVIGTVPIHRHAPSRRGTRRTSPFDQQVNTVISDVAARDRRRSDPPPLDSLLGSAVSSLVMSLPDPFESFRSKRAFSVPFSPELVVLDVGLLIAT